MNRNYIIIGVVALVVVAVIAFMAGSRKSSNPGSVARSNGGGASQMNYSAPQIDFNEIIADLEKQASANPNDPLILAKIGDAHFAQRNFEAALNYYKQALKLNPKDINSYNSAGLCYHYLRNSKEGLKYVNEGIKVDPNYQRIWLTKGFILAWGMGDTKAAIEALNKVIAINPNTEVASAAKNYIADIKGSKAVR